MSTILHQKVYNTAGLHNEDSNISEIKNIYFVCAFYCQKQVIQIVRYSN